MRGIHGLNSPNNQAVLNKVKNNVLTATSALAMSVQIVIWEAWKVNTYQFLIILEPK